MNDLIFYEFPLNERVRLFIRLEQLFHQFDHFMRGRSVWDCRAVVDTLIDIVGVFTRNDLKSEALQEIDRQTAVLNRMAKLYEGVNQDKLTEVVGRLEELSRELYSVPGKLGAPLMENDLFKGIVQRSAMPGGSCSFDLPAYHHWLEGDESARRADLEHWIEPFLKTRSAIEILLNFIRTSATPSQELATAGFFQKSLDHSLAFQLLRADQGVVGATDTGVIDLQTGTGALRLLHTSSLGQRWIAIPRGAAAPPRPCAPWTNLAGGKGP